MSNIKKSPERKRRSRHRPTSRLSEGQKEARPISTARSTAGKGRRGNRRKTPINETPFKSISNCKPSDRVKSPRTPKRSRVNDEGRKKSRSPVQQGTTKPTSKIEKHISQASSPSPPKFSVDREDRKRERKRNKAPSRAPISSEATKDKKKVLANTDSNRRKSSPKPYVSRASSPESPITSVALAGKPQKIRKARRRKKDKDNTSDVISKYQSAVAIQHSSPNKVKPPNPNQSTIWEDNPKKQKKVNSTIPSKQDHLNETSKRRSAHRSTHSPLTSQSVVYDCQEPRKRKQSPPPLQSSIAKKPQRTATILDEPEFKKSIVDLTADQSVFNLQVDPVYNYETERIAMTSCATVFLDKSPAAKCLFGWEGVPIQNDSDPSSVVYVDHFMSGGHTKPKTLDSSQASVPQKSSHSPKSNKRNTRDNRRRQSLESVNLGIEPRPSRVQSPSGKDPSKVKQSPTSSEPEQPKVTRSKPQTSSRHYNFQPGWQQYIHFPAGDRTNENRRLFWYHKSSKCFQWQNPKLLHFKLFNGSTESLSTNPLPADWEVHYEKPISDSEKPPTAKKSSRPVYYNTLNDYFTYADPRVSSLKRQMLLFFIQGNIQKNYQDLWIDKANFMDSVYQQLAQWSTMEFHLYQRSTQVTGLHLQYSNETSLGQPYFTKELDDRIKGMIADMTEEWMHDDMKMMLKRQDGVYEIDELSNSEIFNKIRPPIQAKALKHFYVFGRFLGLAMWLDVPLGAELGLSILGPLRGMQSIPLKVHQWANKGVKEPNGIYKMWKKCQGLNDKQIYAAIDGKHISDKFELNIAAPETAGVTVKKPQNPKKLDEEQPGRRERKHPRNRCENVSFKYSFTNRRELFPADDKSKWKRHFHLLFKVIGEYLEKWSWWTQAQALKNGFKDVLPLEWTRLFDHHELVQLFGRQIDIQQCSQSVTWLWELDVSQEEKMHFQRLFWSTLVGAFRDNWHQKMMFHIFLTENSNQVSPVYEGFYAFQVCEQMPEWSDQKELFCANAKERKLTINYSMYRSLEKKREGHGMSKMIEHLCQVIMLPKDFPSNYLPA